MFLDKNQLNDKEGINFEEQFLSQQRTKLRSIIEKDTQTDKLLDFRDFYIQSYSDDDYYGDLVFSENPIIKINKIVNHFHITCLVHVKSFLGPKMIDPRNSNSLKIYIRRAKQQI